VVKGSTWTGWVIVELIVEFIAKLVAELIVEADLIGLIHDEI
jgi:hypothetical protein